MKTTFIHFIHLYNTVGYFILLCCDHLYNTVGYFILLWSKKWWKFDYSDPYFCNWSSGGDQSNLELWKCVKIDLNSGMVSDANYGSYCPSSCASLQVKATEKQFNSTKIVALNKMKFGLTPTSVSKEMQTPVWTLARWKKDSMETSAGKWTGAAGDSALARPAKRKTDPGSGSNCHWGKWWCHKVLNLLLM